MNYGGRKQFTEGLRVRILLLHGSVSEDIWIVSIPKEHSGFAKCQNVRADRKGHVLLRQENGLKEQKVHFRRILTIDVDGKAPVIELNDKYIVVCPGCGGIENISPEDNTIECKQCGKTQVHWATANRPHNKSLGAKLMSDTVDTKTETVETETVETETVETENTTKPTKKSTRKAIKIDFAAIVGLAKCELWTKKHIKFDHPDVDVQAHAILFTNGETSRKLCFNTYNGAVGKKNITESTEPTNQGLPIDEFINDTEVTTGKRKKPWFNIKDIEKTRTKLTKDGYEQQT